MRYEKCSYISFDSFSRINSDFSFSPILPSFINMTFGIVGLSFIVPGLSCKSFINLSIEKSATLPNSTLTSPCFSFMDFIESFLQIILISARASRLETSSGIGPKRSESSVTIDSNSESVELVWHYS